MKWINASDTLPELPNPLPPDTPDERGILFVNRKHSATLIWYPSYGSKPISLLQVNDDGEGDWSLNQWEWLDESENDIENTWIASECIAFGCNLVRNDKCDLAIKTNKNES